MGNYQWDYGTSTSDYWSSGGTTTAMGSASNSVRWTYYRTSNSTSTSSSGYSSQPWYNYPRVVQEQLLVEAPEGWTEADVADFVTLVNDKTATGWKVQMVLNGDVRLTDPGINVCSMSDFKVKMLRAASAADQTTIRDFFAAHPTDMQAA